MLLGAGVDDMSFGGGDADHAAGDHATGLQFLSLRTITAFGVGFGWTGVAVLNGGGGLGLAIPLALVAGLLLAAIVLFLMRSMRRLSHSGSLDYANAVGQVATVYVTIPPAAAAGGQVEVLVQGRLATVAAVTRGDAPIAPGTKVRVAELADRTTLIVTAL
jgi:membrane protein implicated in regulation of membrane protease activity